MDYDKTNIPVAYNLGRDHGPAFLRLWMDTVAHHVERERVQTILDLGCGTGRFSRGLAETFNATVVGLDPSIKMLNQAPAGRDGIRVLYASGCAEALPLASESVDVVFISMVFHHFTDPHLAARESRRVLRDHGRVCLRTASREMIPQYPYVPFFPAARPLLEQRLPKLSFQQDVFESAGFSTLSRSIVTQQVAEDFFAYAEKLAVKADSIIASLNDADFESGLRELRSNAASMSGPVTEPIDFFVFA
jgi:ubiquinone/menaquinone biosynthesis C-methylase UbiE